MVKVTDGIKKMFEAIIGTPLVAFISTVDAEGKHNVSCKDSLRVIDYENLWYVESTDKKTYENVKKKPYVAVTISSREKMDRYQIKGKAELISE